MRIFNLTMGFLIMATACCAGIMLIYRGSLNLSEMNRIEGTVFSKEQGVKYGYRSAAYYLSFGIKEMPVHLAISYVSKGAIYSDSTFNLIDTGKIYTFFV